MEETDTPPSQRIVSMGLLAFEQITCPTGQPEVILGIGAPACPGNNVVKF